MDGTMMNQFDLEKQPLDLSLINTPADLPD